MKKFAAGLIIVSLPIFGAGCSNYGLSGPDTSASEFDHSYFGVERTTRQNGVVSKESKQDEVSEKESVEFTMAIIKPISTFAADVDTASYSNIRRALKNNTLPKPELVRVEEMLNYFHYDLPEPEKDLLNKTGLLAEKSLGKLRLRHKLPESDKSELMELPLPAATVLSLEKASLNQQWSAGVASFGLLLDGELSSDKMGPKRIVQLLQPALAQEPDAYQVEFYSLVKQCENLF